jgi:hypothetical protein
MLQAKKGRKEKEKGTLHALKTILGLVTIVKRTAECSL